MKNEIIKRAKEALQPINYEPHYPGYFVKMNDRDLGGSDFCENCIEQAVKDARKSHREQREVIINKHKKALASGKYTEAQIKKSQRSQLKEYPKKASFTCEGHDPDFGGGLQEPCTCEGCGEPFQCAFEANKEEAEHLLRMAEAGDLDERDKWEFDVALYHFQYLKPEVQGILLRAATVFLSTQAKNVLEKLQ